MFKEIFLFELKYRIKRPATWAYFGILLLFGFFTAIYGGTPASEKTFANSPYAISLMLTIISFFGMLIASAVMGVPVYRDIEHKVKDYYFSYPISEWGYLGGRYLGSLLILFLISLGLHLGLMIGFALGPYFGLEEADRFGPFSLWSYIQPTLILYWPNLLFSGTLFFALVAISRKVMTTYVASVLLFIGYLLANTLIADLELRDIVDILDPFALNTVQNATKYWTPVDQNALTVPLVGNMLWNRLLWVGVAGVIFVGLLFRFDFQRFLAVKLGKKTKAEKPAAQRKISSIADLPAGKKSFSTGIYFQQMFRQARMEFRNIIGAPIFLAMLLLAVLFLFLDGWFGNPIYGTPSLPMTFYMLEAKDGNYGLFVFILLTFYTGEAVHRDRSVKYDGIANALPVPNWMVYGSKFLAMVIVAFLLANLVIVCGVANQVAKGYFNFEFGKYFTDLYLIEFPEYLQYVFLAFFVHIVVNKKFLGHVATIGVWMVFFGLQGIAELDYNMAIYGNLPNYLISDMNGFGHFGKPLFWFSSYWFVFGLILLITGNLLWNRSSEGSWPSRWQVLKRRFDATSGTALGLALAGWIGIGGFIYYNVSVLNTYQTSEQGTELSAEYEKQYSKYRGIPQPKIIDVVMYADVYPEERKASVRAEMVIVNKTNSRIDSLHMEHRSGIEHAELEKFTWGGQNLEKIFDDEDQAYAIYTIPGGMAAGDTVEMEMIVEVGYKGFTNSGFNREIIYNGTFFNFGVFPTFGYSGAGEISSDQDRKKHDLPEQDYSLPEPDDERGRQDLLFTDDANLVTFEAFVSTSEDQIIIAPGNQQGEPRIENGRVHYHYKVNQPINAFFNISSARYAVHEDSWTRANGSKGRIQIFHHPTHTYNLDRFVDGTRDAIEYFNQEFSSYQFDQLRILEFPRYASFAQSFPNTVPYAESFGWVGNFSDPEDTDYAYLVTAHEVAHQWWAHQIIPGATRGANQLSESMAEYSAFMVLKKKYGDQIVQKQLRYALDRYLRGRGGESKFEKTLLDNDTQQYVWYQKGSLILYALQDYVSEDSLNAAFSQFLQDAAFRAEPPFPNTTEWYSYIQAATPDSLKYFIEDGFENIVIYENRAKEAIIKEIDATTFEVTLDFETQKVYYDGSGTELRRGTDANYIEVGVFAEDTENERGMTQREPLFVEKRWLKPGEHTITFTVNQKPAKAGIDPYNKLIDRVPEDNLIDVEEE